jgi:hypothetical protein
MPSLVRLHGPHWSMRAKGRRRPRDMVKVRMDPEMRETFDRLAAEVFADMTAADYCFTDALTAVFLSGMALAQEVAANGTGNDSGPSNERYEVNTPSESA